MGGVVHGVNELATQGDEQIAQQRVRIRQSDVLEQLTRAGILIQRDTLAETRGIRTGFDRLVDFERLAQMDRGEIRLATRETAENTMAIARGVAAQIQLARRAEERLDRISEATEGTYRNTSLLTVFAQRANEIAGANYSVNLTTANNTGVIARGVDDLVNIGLADLEINRITANNTALIAGGVDNLVNIGLADLGINQATADNTRDIATGVQSLNAINTASFEVNKMTARHTAVIADDTREIVGFTQRAEYARALMVQQLNGMTHLLGDIADGIDTGNYYQALTREAIADCNLTLIQGFSATIEIGRAQLATSTHAQCLIDRPTHCQHRTSWTVSRYARQNGSRYGTEAHDRKSSASAREVSRGIG